MTDKPDKGLRDGSCNRTACQKPLIDEPTRWSMGKYASTTDTWRLYYCCECAADFTKWDMIHYRKSQRCSVFPGDEKPTDQPIVVESADLAATLAMIGRHPAQLVVIDEIHYRKSQRQLDQLASFVDIMPMLKPAKNYVRANQAPTIAERSSIAMKYDVERAYHGFGKLNTESFEVMLKALMELARDPTVQTIEIRGLRK